jgi:hypothetical protein
MTTENIKIEDLSKPVTKSEIEARLKTLTPDQLEQARFQQIDAAILAPKEDKVDWARLSDSDFVKTRMRLFGF